MAENPSAVVLLFSTTIAWLSFKTQRFLTRAKNTIDFETAYRNSKDLKESEDRVRAAIEKMSSEELVDLASKEKAMTELVMDVRETLNTWERASIAINAGVYDEDILYKTYGSYLIGYWTKLRPYINEKQKQNPLLYVSFDWIAIRWMIKRGELKSTKRLKLLKRSSILLNKYLNQ